MGCEPEPWAKEWLARQRAEGKTGLTVEKRGNMHIVKWATTKWDPVTKKRKKISEYRGVLYPDGTLAEPRPQRSRIDVTDVKESGSARFLSKVMSSYLDDLKFAFPNDYPEIVELVVARCLGRGELNKAGRCWKRLEDVDRLRPNTSPKSLSETLERVGLSRGSQDLFFQRLRTEDRQMAIDMSVIFSKARGAKMLKTGYNRFHLSCPQFNLLMGCGLTTGRPQYMKVLPGNVKEGSAVSMLDEFEIPAGTFLVMDRGYYDLKFLEEVVKARLEYIVAAKRNSKAYKIVDTDEGWFRWRKSAVKYGHAPVGDGSWAYRFENLNHRNDEIVDTLRAMEHGKSRKINEDKAGNFVIICSQELPPEQVYRIYKVRCMIEDLFDSERTVLSADSTHMQDDAHVMGHLFITFLSVMVWTDVIRLLEEADLASSMSPEDVLDIYGTMKIVEGDADIRQIVPKDVRELDAQLRMFLYSTEVDLDKLIKDKEKRARKKKS